MLSKLSRRLSYANVMSTIAVFGVLAGGTAYAANTIGSTDIIDGQVKSVDVGDNEIKSSDVKDESLTTFDVSTFLGQDVVDGTLTGADVGDGTLTGFDLAEESIGGNDIANGSIGGSDVADGSLGSFDILDNNLTGNDINEATLATTTTVGIAGGPTDVTLPADETFGKVASRVVPAGSYAIIASANVRSFFSFPGDNFTTGACELRAPDGAVLGSAIENLYTTDDLAQWVSLSLNGMALGVPAGGGEIGLYCKVASGQTSTRRANGQMLILQFDGTRPF